MLETTGKPFDNAERYRDLGCAIAYYRKRKAMTQEQLAESVGISRQHMGAIEAPNMIRAISLDVLFNIAAEVDTKVNIYIPKPVSGIEYTTVYLDDKVVYGYDENGNFAMTRPYYPEEYSNL